MLTIHVCVRASVRMSNFAPKFISHLVILLCNVVR